jgi:hypothetical protein
VGRPSKAFAEACHTTRDERAAGRCRSGHDLNAPQALVYRGGRWCCRECTTRYRANHQSAVVLPRPCRSGKHTIPAGRASCRECARERDQDRRANAPIPRRGPGPVPMYMMVPFPPAEVLAEAACTLADAGLFDLGAAYEPSRDVERRHAAARGICYRCPVRAECLADAIEYRRPGVYGGRVLRWSDDTQPRLVQGVQSVQDSSA